MNAYQFRYWLEDSGWEFIEGHSYIRSRHSEDEKGYGITILRYFPKNSSCKFLLVHEYPDATFDVYKIMEGDIKEQVKKLMK